MYNLVIYGSHHRFSIVAFTHEQTLAWPLKDKLIT
jgi:hypothetical protein